MSRVAIVYPFLPHYRRAAFEALLSSPDHEYSLHADTEDFLGQVRAWVPGSDRPFQRLRCWRFGTNMLQPGAVPLALRRDLDAVVYLANGRWPTTWLSALAARATGKRVLFWTHGWRHGDYGRRDLVRRSFNRIAHGLLLHGHRARDFAISFGFSPDSLYVIYNSLDVPSQIRAREAVSPEARETVRAELFSAPERPLLMCISRLSPGKRLHELAEAADRLAAAGRPVNVLIVGDGPERERLEEAARRASSEVVLFGPSYDEDEIARLFAAADVLVSPGDIGLTAMHALIHGVPVVTHDQDDTQGPEAEVVVEGRTGARFRFGDLGALVDAIERVLDAPPDRQPCRELIERLYSPRFQQEEIDRAVSGAAPRADATRRFLDASVA